TAALREDELAAARAGGGAVRTAEDIEKLIATVRARGFAMTTNSINASFAAVSAPIFDYSGRIAAALTVLGSDKQLTGSRRKATIGALLDAGKRLSQRLGAIDRDDPSPATQKARGMKAGRAGM